MDFTNLPYNGLKNLFNKAISSMISSTNGLSVTCTLHYPITKFEDCSNCVRIPIGAKVSTRYQHGGPVPFPYNQPCPVCNGEGKRGVETSETVELLIIHDPKNFIEAPAEIPNGMIQCIAKKALFPKLQKCSYMIASDKFTGFREFKYKRDTAPMPAGMGDEEFVVSNWVRI